MTERWKPIVGWSNYKISSSGRVWSISSGRLLIPVLNARGYLCVCLSNLGMQKTIWIHKLVLNAFIGIKSSGQQARHLDGDKLNNCFENLCWGSAKENYNDQVTHGVSIHAHQKGQDNHASKLTDIDVEQIRYLHLRGLQQKDIALKFGVSRACICLIISGQHWPHLAAVR